MKIKSLYKYIREDGGVTISPIEPDCEYTVKYRIIADDGKAITNDGENLRDCVDTESIDGWYEVELPEEVEAETIL